jgi:hypothetical protein
MYFVTICARERAGLFGKIKSGEVGLNEVGRIGDECWHDLPKHIHGIIHIVAGLKPALTSRPDPAGSGKIYLQVF